MRGVVAAVVFLSLALGVCQVASFHRGHPVGTDYFVYSVALDKAEHGQDPYEPRSIGWGYLYPPPSLLLLKTIAAVSPGRLGPTLTFLGISVLAVLLSIVVLAAQFTYWNVCVALLLATSAGVIETIWIGQINAVVVFLLVVFLRAWRRQAYFLASVALGLAVCLKITPLAFVLLFLVSSKLRWLVPLAAIIVALSLAAQWVLPAPHLMSSFLTSFRWAAQQSTYSSWNYSLSSNAAALLNWVGVHRTWNCVQAILLFILSAQLAAGIIAQRKFRNSADAVSALFATCNVCMVVAPNLVWLHHAALLIPAFWILLVEVDVRAVRIGALVALLCIQSARCLQGVLGVPAALPIGIGQALLLLTCALYTASLFRTEPARRTAAA